MSRWFFLLFFFITIQTSFADSIYQPFGGDSKQWLFIDDDGGSYGSGGGVGLSYYLNFNGVNQSARGTLMLYDGSGVDDGVGDDDFAEGTGINLYILPKGELSGIGFLGAASIDPLLPVSFTASNQNIKIEQYSYSSIYEGDDFIVLEYRVINQNNFSIPVKIAMAHDFDLDQKSKDYQAGFSAENGLLYMQDAIPRDPDYTSVGLKVTAGTLDQFRINLVDEDLGPIMTSVGEDEERIAFFAGDTESVGDLSEGVLEKDYEISLSANLGELKPEQFQVVAFCLLASNGNSVENSFNNLAAQASSCDQFYQKIVKICGNGIINAQETCDDANVAFADGCSGDCLSDETCGNGYVDVAIEEVCDDANTVSGDGCRADCKKIEVCGDGLQDANEVCDDGNSNNDDGCDQTCNVVAILSPPVDLFKPSLIEGSEASQGCRLSKSASQPISMSVIFGLLLLTLIYIRRGIRLRRMPNKGKGNSSC